jgi:hypothetical protein
MRSNYFLVSVAVLLLAGCVEEKAPPAPPLTAQERAEIGVRMAMAVVDQPAPPAPEPGPGPAPRPQPGDVCPECEGRGKVSRDGSVFTVCLPCRGTGRVQAEQVEQAHQVGNVGEKGKPKMRTVYRKVCDPKTGTCRLVPEQEPIP